MSRLKQFERIYRTDYVASNCEFVQVGVLKRHMLLIKPLPRLKPDTRKRKEVLKLLEILHEQISKI